MSAPSNERDCYSVDEFCTRNAISKGTFYNWIAAGCAPRTMKIGRRTLIAVEDAAAWRRTCKQASSSRGTKAAVAS